MGSRLAYPEIEARTVPRERNRQQVYSVYDPPATLLDLLEIRLVPGGKVTWKERLDHNSLLEHFSGATSSVPLLRVLFLGTVPQGSGAELLAQLRIFQCARLHPATAHWMRDSLGVSPIFLECLTAGNSVLKTGSIKFLKRDDSGNVVAINGFYRYSSGFGGGQAHVWFSHDLVVGSSTYILDNCSALAKDLIKMCAFGPHPEALGRPCSIDAFIAEDCGQAWGEEITLFRNQLLKYEHMRAGLQNLTPAETSSAVENLHYISQNFHIMFEDITDLEERLDFLRGVHALYVAHSQRPRAKESVEESLEFVASRTRIWKRWAVNYKDRTEIRINLFFNLATQMDNRTNLDIASFTSKIAVDTQRDSSSMITIAAVTMFFLPGTFVSAIFSMVFFNSASDSNGRANVTVSPQWWYFVAITVPLTIVVFSVWVFWQRWRNHVKGIKNEDVAEAKV